MLDILILIVGFVFLIKGADIFVDASVNIATKLKVPSVIIGLTIVAMGTSAPEAVVSITASVRGAGDIAIGNIVGSNIFNLLVVIGICAVIKPFSVNLKEIVLDFWLSIFGGICLILLIIFFSVEIPQIYSGILLAIFVIYIFWLIRNAIKNKTENDSSEIKKSQPFWLSIFLAVIGCTCIIIGGKLSVDSAQNIAVSIGISERIIGLTVLAVGTSLPELVTSIIACKKGENSLALGNVIGSNIFNIFFILGIAGTITPLETSRDSIFDLAVLIGGSLLALLFTLTKKQINRIEGSIMIVVYTGYVVYICLN